MYNPNGTISTPSSDENSRSTQSANTRFDRRSNALSFPWDPSCQPIVAELSLVWMKAYHNYTTIIKDHLYLLFEGDMSVRYTPRESRRDSRSTKFWIADMV